MQSLQARIDSFQKTKRIKRYPSKPSSSTASVKWPHPPDFKANATTLAEAGFYFSPSWDDRDSVECFLCGKELSDWDSNDDPFEIHYTKCRTSCAWAVVRCGLIKDLDNRGCFEFEDKKRLPCSRAMETARLQTFKSWWPHDGEPGHEATSIKMAQAGFVYTPQAAGDDTVTCLYCNLSLGGWETGDDPIQEHRRRDSKSGPVCPFLSFSEQLSEDVSAAVHAGDPPLPRPKRGKARATSSTASSRPRRKTKTTRGKSLKSASSSRRSPSLRQSVSRELDPAAGLDAPTDGNISPALGLASHPSARPLSSGSCQNNDAIYNNGSTDSLPPRVLGGPDTTHDTIPDHVALLLSAGQPMITTPQPLTDHERTMSLEQWIQQEISLGYERLLTDGQRQIELFKAKAAELRKCINAL